MVNMRMKSPIIHEKRNKCAGFACIFGLLLGWTLHSILVNAIIPLGDTNDYQRIDNLLLSSEQILPIREHDHLSLIFAQRPNWRTDYELTKWLPPWLPSQTVERWKSLRTNEAHQSLLYGGLDKKMPTSDDERKQRDDYFWKTVIESTKGWALSKPSTFTCASANNGFGHRLAMLSYSYLCNVFPNRKQQLIHWRPAGLKDNRVWHHLFEDSPVLMGLPAHWEVAQDPLNASSLFGMTNAYRNSTGQMGELRTSGISQSSDCSNGDYNMYFQFGCGHGWCKGYVHPRDLWLLRIAKEPSAQEFYMLLRAQLRQHIKEKVAKFIEKEFPKDKIVVGVHIRAGNGKDDGGSHFNDVNRGDWLNDIPAAIRMVRKHLRMIAYSIIDRYNLGVSGGIDFSKAEFDAQMDGNFRIFLATDSPVVLEEFRRQHPNILTLPQDRMPAGEGVMINKPLPCPDKSSDVDCEIHAQEAMFMDAMIMSSCDAALAESYSNFMYTIPSTIMMAEGRIFCESGRAALGGKYVLDEKATEPTVFGGRDWWVHPPPNIMPVRCYQGGWAARDRSNLYLVPDIN